MLEFCRQLSYEAEMRIDVQASKFAVPVPISSPLSSTR